ncbi:SRPBCC family protein [Gallaecimonas sp. GXIMD4217]|uniref:SRPBCC family protein n=1 Tax=Gallaecimonas sp. GXIMD4217 TaxID=3131927 RepID=UPI00311B17E1
MNLLKRLLALAILLVVAFMVIGLFLPREVQVERRIHIDAAPAAVYAKVSDLRSFNDWSPWYELDPQAQYQYEGPDAGVGAKMSWHSDKPDVGSGSQEIVEVSAPGYVAIRLDFGDQGQADSYFRIREEKGGSELTWGFRVDFGNDIMGRYMGLMMDTMVGGEYEKGLAKLKGQLESEG